MTDTEEDFLATGWTQVDQKLMDAKAPRIRYSPKFRALPPQDQLDYVKGLADSYNHISAILQDDNTRLNKLVFEQEKKITELAAALEQNNEMIYRQVSDMNMERQMWNDSGASRPVTIRELKAKRDASRARAGQ